MATLASAPLTAQTRRSWFWQFLRDELEAYPERVQLVGQDGVVFVVVRAGAGARVEKGNGFV